MPSSGNNPEEAWSYLERRFGIIKEDSGCQLKKSSGDYWLVSQQSGTNLEAETHGIRCLRTTGRGLKPTTYALQLLADHLTKNVVEVNKEELLKLLRREEMIPRDLDTEGYVAIEFDNRVIGCGFYKNEKVSSRIPKGRGKELAEILESGAE